MGKIVQKIYLIYIYIRPVPVKNIKLSIHVRMNEYALITATNNALRSAHAVAHATTAAHFHSSPSAVLGSESQHAGYVLEVSK